MASRSHRNIRLKALVAVLLIGLLTVPVQAAENCWYDPISGELVCNDGGGGGGSVGTSYWTSWTIVGPCGGAGVVGGTLVDIHTGSITAARYRIEDGVAVETQFVCFSLSDGEEAAWTAVTSAVQALPDARWESNPDPAVSKGLTGLETWLWSSNPSQVGPITATWTEPITGLVFGVEGRGWTESLTWLTGDSEYEAFAGEWDLAPGMGGSPDFPAATHIYNTTSAAAGHPLGYSVALEQLWVGEYRISVPSVGGGVWTSWGRFTSTLTETVTDIYEVVEVRSKLTG
jgi:hypothetical protein